LKKTPFRYPKDLDKFEGDPAGFGGEYINPTHIRLPTDSEPEGTCLLCHGRTYQTAESKLSPADPPWHRCENCGRQANYGDEEHSHP
tara:strand:+ start:287 stop:547 length:261 start_codon:yes stop_codon:yes gene_type:complete